MRIFDGASGVHARVPSVTAAITDGVIITTVPTGARAYYYEVAYTLDGKTCYTTSVMIEN